MRKIKFRAWDVSKAKMIVVDQMTFRTNGDVFNVWDSKISDDVPGLLINPTSGILMQYIGIKDKNGKDIYDGDKLQTVLDDGTRLSTFIVEWIEDYARFMIIREHDNEKYGMNQSVSKNKEIIGNIHEN